MERRDFLKIASVTGATTAAFGCTPKATEKLIPYLVPEEEIVPGVATWYATVCGESPESLGIQVKTREGRPILIQGNPAHPLSGGAVDALTQASLQGLYDPDRVKGPAVRTGERFRAVAWSSAERLLVHRLRQAEDGVYFLSGHTTGSLDALIDRWLAAFGSPNRVVYEAYGHEPLLAANRLVFGREEVPLYDVASARYLISFGADFLETWIAPTFFARGFTALHAFRAQDGGMGKFVHVEPRLSMTAANADEWIAPRPGTEMLIALAMANAIGGAGAGAAGVPLADFTPETVAERTDVPAETIRRLAREFASATPSLALGSGVATTHRKATETWTAVNVLNQVAGNVGRTVRFGPTFHVARGETYRGMEELVQRMRDGRVRVLLVHGANPVFSLPPELGFAEALKNVPFKVSLGTFYDETAAHADLLLPASHALESWGDAVPVDGVRGLMQPVIRPLHDTRMLGDILLASARAAGVDAELQYADFYAYLRESWGMAGGAATAAGTAAPPPPEWTEALRRGGIFTEDLGVGATAAARAHAEATGMGSEAGTAGAEAVAARTEAAVAAVETGVAPGPEGAATAGVAAAAAATAATGERLRPAATFGDVTLEAAEGTPTPTAAAAGAGGAPAAAQGGLGELVFEPAFFEGDEDGLFLMPVPTVTSYDGRGANKPWLQELPDPVTKAVWGSWVEIHPDTGRRLGIAHGDVVRVSSPHGAISVPAFLYPGIRRDTAAIPIGQGHREYGRFAKGVGANPVELLPADVDPVSGGRIWFGTRVKLTPGGGGGPLIEMQGSPHQHSRGIALALSLPEAAEAVARPEESETAELMERIVGDAQPESPYRWGMTIDLAKCVGCSACVTACYMENNIAWVGPEDCSKGRELTWLRIERYWEEPANGGGARASNGGSRATNGGAASGGADGLSVRHLPMLCQHCGQAPCEPVCPVYAAYHNPEGLNAQVYNRCVGTRYCANNCPYKVRKFNFFQYRWPEPMNLGLNPDVTVRSKGVMEKCTFCVQRIRERKIQAKQEGRAVRDGEIVTACQAACPTDAIMFGNLRDPRSAVYRAAMEGRGYSVLADVNTRSAITYLADVVHTDRPLSRSGGHGERGASHGVLSEEEERRGGKREGAVGSESAPFGAAEQNGGNGRR